MRFFFLSLIVTAEVVWAILTLAAKNSELTMSKYPTMPKKNIYPSEITKLWDAVQVLEIHSERLKIECGASNNSTECARVLAEIARLLEKDRIKEKVN